MKKWQKIILWILFIIATIIFFKIIMSPERRIRSFVKWNESKLEELSREILDNEGALPNGKKKYKGVEIEGLIEGEHAIVRFYYTGTGLVPATTYYGFYYAPANVPVTSFNGGVLIPEAENTWIWGGEGDNGGRIKKIKDCWYYYEAWY